MKDGSVIREELTERVYEWEEIEYMNMRGSWLIDSLSISIVNQKL